MAVFVVTWNINNAKDSYSAVRKRFIERLERYENKADPDLETVRFIASKKSVEDIYANLREKLDSDDALFLSEIVSGDYSGWLDGNTWEWIESHL